MNEGLNGLELNSPGHLYGSWLADRSIPRAERRVRGVANISIKSRIASEVLTFVIDKVMGIERIEEIQAELLEVTLLNPGPLIPPYEEGQEDKQKLKLAYQALRRSIKRKDRLSALINAYFLGKVLNNVEGPRQEYILKKELTSHYITMAENAYILFEFDPTQIFRTVNLDIRDIRRMKKKDIVTIASTTMNILVGTRNLEGESC